MAEGGRVRGASLSSGARTQTGTAMWHLEFGDELSDITQVAYHETLRFTTKVGFGTCATSLN